MTPERMAALRWWLLTAAVAVVIALGISYVQRFGAALDQARTDRDALRAQVVRMGGTPVAGPSGRDGNDGAAGPTGAAGRAHRITRTGGGSGSLRNSRKTWSARRFRSGRSGGSARFPGPDGTARPCR